MISNKFSDTTTQSAIKNGTNGIEAKSQKVPFDNEAVLQNLIRSQIEYFFSDYNLTNDTYLLSRMSESEGHWVPLDLVCRSPRIRSLTCLRPRILAALAKSVFLELSPDKTKVRRPGYLLPSPRKCRDLRRTVFLYGVSPLQANETAIRKLMQEYGEIKRVHMEGSWSEEDDSPDKYVSAIITKKKILLPFLRRYHSQWLREAMDATISKSNHSHGDSDLSLQKDNEQEYFEDILDLHQFEQFMKNISIIAKQTKPLQNRVDDESPSTSEKSEKEWLENKSIIELNSKQESNGKVEEEPKVKEKETSLCRETLYQALQSIHPHIDPNHPLEMSHLSSCFVVFASQSQATKCVKDRSRSDDGVRAMHKYDYNKLVKKYKTAELKGETVSASPSVTRCTNHVGQTLGSIQLIEDRIHGTDMRAHSPQSTFSGVAMPSSKDSVTNESNHSSSNGNNQSITTVVSDVGINTSGPPRPVVHLLKDEPSTGARTIDNFRWSEVRVNNPRIATHVDSRAWIVSSPLIDQKNCRRENTSCTTPDLSWNRKCDTQIRPNVSPAPQTMANGTRSVCPNMWVENSCLGSALTVHPPNYARSHPVPVLITSDDKNTPARNELNRLRSQKQKLTKWNDQDLLRNYSINQNMSDDVNHVPSMDEGNPYYDFYLGGVSHMTMNEKVPRSAPYGPIHAIDQKPSMRKLNPLFKLNKTSDGHHPSTKATYDQLNEFASTHYKMSTQFPPSNFEKATTLSVMSSSKDAFSFE